MALAALLATVAVPMPGLALTECPDGATEWLGGDGDWTDDNWSAGAPDMTTIACIEEAGAYTVAVSTFDNPAAELHIVNSEATLLVLNGASIDSFGPVTNEGTIELGTSPAEPASAPAAAAAPLAAGDPAQLQGTQLSNNGQLLTNPLGETPTGAHRFWAPTEIVNLGLISVGGPTQLATDHWDNVGVAMLGAPTQFGGPSGAALLDNGGEFHVDSFFDIFTEVMIDNEGYFGVGVDAPGGLQTSSGSEVDTLINRADGTLELGPPAVVEVEIVQLELQSVTPVHIAGTGAGEHPEILTTELQLPDPPGTADDSFFDVHFEVGFPPCQNPGETCPDVPIVNTPTDPQLDTKAYEVRNPEEPQFEHDLVWDDPWMSITTTIPPFIDIEVDKTATVLSDPGTEPRLIEFEVTVSNATPPANVTAAGVEVTDDMSSGLSIQGTPNASAGSFDPETGVWAVGSLAPGQQETLTFVVQQDSQGPHGNCAEATAYDGNLDPDSAPANSAPSEDDVACAGAPEIDIEVTKWVEDLDDEFEVEPRQFRFTVMTSNDSSAASVDATDVVVLDQLPDGLDHVSHTATKGTYNPVSGEWTIGTLAPGESATLEITAEVVGTGSQVNCAYATSYTGFDFDSAPGAGPPPAVEDDEGCVLLRTDVEVGKALADELDPSEDGTRIFRFEVVAFNAPHLANAATVAATDVFIEDVLPPELTLVGATVPNGTELDVEDGTWTIPRLEVGALEVLELDLALTGDPSAPIETCAHAASYGDLDDDSDPGNFDPVAGPTEDDEGCDQLLNDVSVTKALVEEFEPLEDGTRRFRFEIDARNGPGVSTPSAPEEVAATDVVIEDLLPAEMSFSGFLIPAGTDLDVGTGTWTIPRLESWETKTLVVEADLTGDPTAPIENCAHAISYSDLDPDSDPDNFASVAGPTEDDEDCALLRTDVEVTKNLTSEQRVGETIEVTFDVIVSNTSAATVDATDIEIADPMPPGLTLTGVTHPFVTDYDLDTGTWTIPRLAPGASHILELEADVTGEAHENCATATAYSDLDADSSPGPFTTTPVEDDEDCADLAIDIEVTKQIVADVENGDGDREVTWEVTATNALPTATTTAVGVEVEEVLPAGLILQNDPADYDSFTGIWTVGDLAPGESVTLTLLTTVASRGPITNCAQASAYEGVLDADSDPGGATTNDPPSYFDDDEACATLPEIDIELDKTVDDASPFVGQQVTFTLTVENATPAATQTAEGVVVSDPLPAGVTYVSHTAGGGSTYNPITGQWNVGNLAAGATRTLTVIVEVDEAGEFDNCAEAIAYTDLWDFDSEPDNLLVFPSEDDEDCVTVDVALPPFVDVELEKEADVGHHVPGDEFTYTLTVRNHPEAAGPAGGVEVTEYLPDGVTVLNATASQGTYDETGDVWDVGALAAGQAETLELLVRTTKGGPLRNCADVTAHTGADRDSVPGDFDPETDDPDDDDEACVDTGAAEVGVEAADDAPPAGSDVAVTVTARDTQGNPIPGAKVGLGVDGANGPGFGRPGSPPTGFAAATTSSSKGRYAVTGTTGADGSRTFTITGFNPGIDTVTAFIDDDGDELADPDEIVESLTLTWSGDGTAIRLAGQNREETAVASSKAAFPLDGSARAVVLTRRDEFADGLAGTPFARSVDAPLLVTATASLHDATTAELQRVLSPGGTVYLLGGTAALSATVAAQVAGLGYRVERIGGDTRYETAVQIAERLGDVDAIFVSRSLVFADALAAGPAAIAANGAIVLSAEDQPHATTDAYLTEHPGAQVFAVGGPAATAYPTAIRIAGQNREETAVLVAERFFDDAPVVGFARKDEFVDALTGGVHIGRLGGPVLLTESASLHRSPAGYLDAHRDTLTQAYVYGGPVAVSEQVRDAVGARLP